MIRMLVILLGVCGATGAAGQELSGPDAYGDWKSDRPGQQRRITAGELPRPLTSPSASNPPRQARRPAGAMPQVPEGFEVRLFAEGLRGPRAMRTAPNGDVFLAETWNDRVLLFRAGQGDTPRKPEIFATGLSSVFGLALGPSADTPQFLYVATPTGVARFAYRPGDARAAGAPEWLVRNLPGGGHAMRDVAFSPDGSTLYVSVGSLSNVGQGTGGAPGDLAGFEAARLPGAAWGQEDGRAALLAFGPDGSNRRFFATGLRNCSALTIQPATGAPWCVVNERDGLGDDLPPDYATSVAAGGFYGWPWYYIGANEDPRHKGARPDLRVRVSVPDVLLQPHSAPLGIVFYEGAMFPPAYKGDAFVALHGSWNRAKRTGYKVVRLRFENGKPTGGYEDFMTGFAIDDASVWGRPVGVTVMQDGSLLVSEDGSNTIWRVTYRGK